MLSILNPQQREAAEHTNGPLFVVAGAGSGKTRALTHRIAYLLERGVRHWEILAVTFTNKAAGEMKERVQKLMGEDFEIPLIGTFHSIGVRILRAEFENLGRDRNFSILDADDSLFGEVLKYFCADVTAGKTSEFTNLNRNTIMTYANHITSQFLMQYERGLLTRTHHEI